MGGRRTPATPAVTRVAALLAATLLAGMTAACTQDPEEGLPRAASAVRLVAAEDCDELVETTRSLLEAQVAGWWSGGEDGLVSSSGAADAPATTAVGTPGTAASELSAAGTAVSPRSDEAAGRVVAGINQQEAGVAEGDPVATDGRRIVTVVDGVLRVTRLDGTPAVDGTVDLRIRRAAELLLRGDTAVVIGGGWGRDGVPVPIDGPIAMEGGPVAATEGSVAVDDVTAPEMTPPSPTTTTTPATTAPTTTPSTTAPTTTSSTTTTSTTTTSTTVPPGPPGPPLTEPAFPEATTITLVDLSDPAAPRVTGTAEFEGSPVATRMTGDGAVRIVVRSTPAAVQELWSATEAAEARAVVADLGPDDVLPRVRLDGAAAEPAGDCADVLSTPAGATAGTGSAELSMAMGTGGMERVTVLTVRDSLDDLAPVSVQGSAGTVYASTEALYVASGRWDGSGGPSTDVHRFDLTGSGPAAYRGSGSVPGTLLDQYSLSERSGDLRLVTTTEDLAEVPTTLMPAPGDLPVSAVPSTEGRLAVLRPDGDRLVEVGHVDDLGVGEQVRSVRFLDDMAYVVTFRRTDPLYAVSVADPTAPRVLGELKIPGFSEYLHPVGDGLLLGVGRQVDPDTLEDTGLKLSLFDVSDPAAPTERGVTVLADTWSNVSVDPHAFTWDPTRSRAMLPISGPDGPSLLVVGVGADGPAEVARLRHTAPFGPVEVLRSVVVDDDLWTVSSAGLGRSDADAPAGVDLTAY